MLVVTRRPGQSILIGRDIRVFVLEVDGMQVRTGIDAPISISIVRTELLTRTQARARRAVEEGRTLSDEEIPNEVRRFLSEGELRSLSGLAVPEGGGSEIQAFHPGGPER